MEKSNLKILAGFVVSVIFFKLGKNSFIKARRILYIMEEISQREWPS